MGGPGRFTAFTHADSCIGSVNTIWTWSFYCILISTLWCRSGPFTAFTHADTNKILVLLLHLLMQIHVMGYCHKCQTPIQAPNYCLLIYMTTHPSSHYGHSQYLLIYSVSSSPLPPAFATNHQTWSRY